MQQNVSFSGSGGGQRARRSGEESRPPGRAARLVCLVALALTIGGGAAHGQLSGQFGLDLVARRIPTTVTDEIKLDTPSEFAMLEFGIASALKVRLDLGPAKFLVDTATNMAGPEHLVVGGHVAWRDLAALGLSLDEATLSPELWLAVPFEAVLDVNNLPNAVLIPPADPMFVALRCTTSLSSDSWSVKELLMFEDVNFPAPGASFAPLYYPTQSQSYAWGSLTYISWSAPVATSFGAVIGLSASTAPTSVKGYSAVGSVDPDSAFLTLSGNGIFLGDVAFGPFAASQVQISASTTLTSTQTPALTIGLTGALSDGATISTSLTLNDLQPLVGGIMLTLKYGPYQAAFALDRLDLTSLSLSCGTPLNLGGMTGAFDVSVTGLERGLTGLALRLTVAQGLFSAGTSVTLAQLGGKFGFASLGTQLRFRIPPGAISIQATFGRYGLTRASVSTGVTF